MDRPSNALAQLFALAQLTAMALGLNGDQLARKQSALANSPSMEKCINRMHVQHSNLKKIVECMARSANLTAFMEDTLWKVDLLAHYVDKLETIPSPDNYIPSPYEHIDDVLKIKAKSVAGFSCLGKQQVIQAIRRKLEHFNLMNARRSTLFDWPSTQPRMRTEKTSKIDGNPLIRLKASLELAKELNCLIFDAIQRHTKPKVGK